MRRGTALLGVAALLAVLAGCSPSQEPTAEEWTRRYREAITAHGGEMAEYNPVVTEFDPEDTRTSLALETLGLSIVKHGASLHGAQLHMDSQVGRGTCIQLRFPKA